MPMLALGPLPPLLSGRLLPTPPLADAAERGRREPWLAEGGRRRKSSGLLAGSTPDTQLVKDRSPPSLWLLAPLFNASRALWVAMAGCWRCKCCCCCCCCGGCGCGRPGGNHNICLRSGAGRGSGAGQGLPWIRGRPGTTVDQGQARDYRGSGAGQGLPWIRGRPGTTVDQGQARDYRGSGAGHSGTTVDQGQATQGLPWIRGRPGTTVDQGQARELGTNGKVIVVIKILCHHDSIFTMVPPLS